MKKLLFFTYLIALFFCNCEKKIDYYCCTTTNTFTGNVDTTINFTFCDYTLEEAIQIEKEGNKVFMMGDSIRVNQITICRKQ